MTNEFIFWRKHSKDFTKDLSISGITVNEALEEDEDWKAFSYIGKTDIEGNKIYADSSIVEFEVIEGCCCDIMEIFCDCEYIKRIGYFSYDDNNLMYEIKSKQDDDFNRIYNLYRDRIKNLKIIDTLQENKLGLIGEKSNVL